MGKLNGKYLKPYIRIERSAWKAKPAIGPSSIGVELSRSRLESIHVGAFQKWRGPMRKDNPKSLNPKLKA